MEFIELYSSELMLGGSGTLGTIMVAIIKSLANKVGSIEKRLAALEKDLEINTALDRERHGKK